MKSYKPTIQGKHTIKYTLQYGEYKGSFLIKHGGNCKGSVHLDNEIFEFLDMDGILESDCSLKINEEFDCFKCILHNEDGNELIIDNLDEQDMADMLVAIEIVDYEPEFQ